MGWGGQAGRQVPAACRGEGQGRPRNTWRRLLSNRATVPSLIVLALVVLMGAFAPYLAEYDPIRQNMRARLQGPSAEHWMGTDELGRDVFARIAFGARTSLLTALAGALLGTLCGTVLGLFSGYWGGRVDDLLMRLADVMLSFPAILLRILIVSLLGPGLDNLIIAVAVWNTPGFARIVRANVLSIREKEFVEAARSVGSGAARTMWRHILPNTMSPIVVQATLAVPWALLTAAGLGFLGLGAQPPAPEWGAMISSGRHHIRDAIHLALFPGLAIAVTVLAISFLGDALRDALDPRL